MPHTYIYTHYEHDSNCMIPAFKRLFMTLTSKSNKTMTIPEPASQAAIAAVKDAAVTSNIDSCPATAGHLSH